MTCLFIVQNEADGNLLAAWPFGIVALLSVADEVSWEVILVIPCPILDCGWVYR